MTGAGFWAYVAVVAATIAAFITVFRAAWRDHDDHVDRYAIGSHRWPIDDEGEFGLNGMTCPTCGHHRRFGLLSAIPCDDLWHKVGAP